MFVRRFVRLVDGRWWVVLGDNFSGTVDFQLLKVLVKYTSAQG